MASSTLKEPMRVMKGSPLLTAPDTLMRPPSTALLNLLVLVPIDT